VRQKQTTANVHCKFTCLISTNESETASLILGQKVTFNHNTEFQAIFPNDQQSVPGGPEKMHKIEWNGFHQNIQEVQKNKDADMTSV